MIDLSEHEWRKFSQNGEDGVIARIFDLISPVDRFYVEFGVGNGKVCNTRCLRETCGWSGLSMDKDHACEEIGLVKQFITRDNITDIFRECAVPLVFDLLSVDIDYNDFHVLLAILRGGYRPRVLICEYNASLSPGDDKVVVYDAGRGWARNRYFGASLLALTRLVRTFGYELIYAEKRGVNAFFVEKAWAPEFKDHADVDKIYRLPAYGKQKKKQKPFTWPAEWKFLSSMECMAVQDA